MTRGNRLVRIEKERLKLNRNQGREIRAIDEVIVFSY
jgi:hypothetical protein